MIVYTVNFGKYDFLRPPLEQHIPLKGRKWPSYPKIKFVRYTDVACPKDYQEWENRHFFCEPGTEVLTMKWIKYHPHVLFPDEEESIWMDSTCAFMADVYDVWDEAMSGHDYHMAMYRHPMYECVYPEVDRCIKFNLEDPGRLKLHKQFLKDRGMPEKLGLGVTTILFRRRHHAAAELSELWWKLTRHRLSRDQVTLPYCLWRLGVQHHYVPWPESDFTSDKFTYCNHAKHRDWRKIVRRADERIHDSLYGKLSGV